LATSPTRVAASSNSHFVFSEEFIRDPNYNNFSDMVFNINIYFGLPAPRLGIGIRVLYIWLLPNSGDAHFGGGLWLLGMGLAVGRRLKTIW
jgi:hypothetical protein